MKTEVKLGNENIKIPEVEVVPKRKFRKEITVGVLEQLDMTIGELSELNDLKNMKPVFLRKFINAMMLEGKPITVDTGAEELQEIIAELSSFLELSQRRELAKERLRENRLPKH